MKIFKSSTMKCKLILPKPTIEEIPDDDEWKNQTINSIKDDMDLLISYINGNMDRNIWINAKSTTATEIQAEINLKKKSYHWKNKSQRNSTIF